MAILRLRDGQPGDYVKFLSLIHPLREAGLSVHLTLGNHDEREVFLDADRKTNPSAPLQAGRYNGIVETRHANFFPAHSKKTMIAQGDLGQQQRDWLARELDAEAVSQRSSWPITIQGSWRSGPLPREDLRIPKRSGRSSRRASR